MAIEDLLYTNTYTAQPYGVFKALGGGFGAGKTAKQWGAYNAGNSDNSRAADILQKINSKAGVGTFNEGQIYEAMNQYQNLKNELDQGKISQAEFSKITDSFVPNIYNYAHQVAQSGSAGAKAVQQWLPQLGQMKTDSEIYKAGQQYLGRDITAAELARFKPKFADGTDIGNAYIAEFAKQEAASPEALAKKAGQYTGDVNNIFNDLLKRGASQDEIDYFGRALASGQTTAYQLKQYVQSLPEYQGQQDTAFRKSLSDELSNYDSQAFNREKENILSSYTKAGLQNSSALDFAITDALSKMQTNRDQFLGGLSAQQYGGNKEAALGTYKRSQDQYLNNLDYQRNQGQSNLNYLTQRADQGADYTRQMQDYLNYLQSQPQQKGGSAWGSAIGGLLGAGAGAFLGKSPQAAQVGYGIGSNFGYLM